MNRPLAFRVFWQGKMYRVLGLNPLTETVYLSHYDVTGCPGDDILVSYAESPDPDDLPAVLMQFTGIRDWALNNAYEGDIFEDDSVWYRIVWDDDRGNWYAQGLGGWEGLELYEFAGTHWTIQGNCYENPDLEKKLEAA